MAATSAASWAGPRQLRPKRITPAGGGRGGSAPSSGPSSGPATAPPGARGDAAVVTMARPPGSLGSLDHEALAALGLHGRTGLGRGRAGGEGASLEAVHGAASGGDALDARGEAAEHARVAPLELRPSLV